MSNPQRTECARSAIELMAAWLGCPDGPSDRLVERLRNQVDGHPSGDRVVGATELIMGMTYLCGSLLVMREFETGITGQETRSTSPSSSHRASGDQRPHPLPPLPPWGWGVGALWGSTPRAQLRLVDSPGNRSSPPAMTTPRRARTRRGVALDSVSG